MQNFVIQQDQAEACRDRLRVACMGFLLNGVSTEG